MARVWYFLSRIASQGVSGLLHYNRVASYRPTHPMVRCVVAVCKYKPAVNRIFDHALAICDTVWTSNTKSMPA